MLKLDAAAVEILVVDGAAVEIGETRKSEKVIWGLGLE
jgi:hypothetical protein